MSATIPEPIKKQVKTYKVVFAVLIVGTIVTVAVAKIHLAISLAIVLALIVATIKGSLVAGYFMHLLHEQKWVYGVLVLTAIFCVALISLLMGTYGDQQGVNIAPVVQPQIHTHVHHEDGVEQ